MPFFLEHDAAPLENDQSVVDTQHVVGSDFVLGLQRWSLLDSSFMSFMFFHPCLYIQGIEEFQSQAYFGSMLLESWLYIAFERQDF